MLLAYYVAAVNIEMTYNSLRAEAAKRDGKPEPEYVPFNGIALADTFQVHEDDDALDLEIFKENNERIGRQKSAPIQVIVGNPPYSVGQKSANDLNENLKYPTLDGRIEGTYAARSVSTNKNSLYDSYLRAFRWATDRIDDQGVVAFVSNGGWLNANSGDGVRLSFVDDFSDIYVYNLRGNQRTAGEESRKEGGKVFGSGSRNTVVITIGVKDPNKSGCEIHYHDIGDYLTAEQKLDIVNHSSLETIEWDSIWPNSHGDWLQQRSVNFETWPVIGDKKKSGTQKVFCSHGMGLGTSRDTWVYNFSLERLRNSVQIMCDTYNRAVQSYGQSAFNTRIDFLRECSEFTAPDKIKWSSSLDKKFDSGILYPINEVITSRCSLYRPFNTQHVFYDKFWNHRVSQLPSMFPTPEHKNIGFYVVNPGSAKPFSALATDLIPDLAMYGSNAGQFFPRFTWEKVEPEDGGLFGAVGVDKREESKYGVIGEEIAGYVRVDNITEDIKKLYWDTLGADITGDDIFHFVYGKLHDPVTTLIYNRNVVISDIPEEADRYMLGARSAVAWLINRYQVNDKDKSGIVNDPNDWCDEVGNPRYIVDLIGKVVRVAVETVRIVDEL